MRKSFTYLFGTTLILLFACCLFSKELVHFRKLLVSAIQFCSWVRKRSLPKPLCHACVLEVNNDLYLLGGITQKKRRGKLYTWSSNTVYRYTSLCEVWVEFTEMITPRHDAGAVAIGKQIQPSFRYVIRTN